KKYILYLIIMEKSVYCCSFHLKVVSSVYKDARKEQARVVVWMMGVANSYTMEASLVGSSLGGRTGTHFTTQDYEQMGRHFCETLLDFCDQDPSK
ncbi:hypothetical protein L9F63_027089, partial [Diploptera punctata]